MNIPVAVVVVVSVVVDVPVVDVVVDSRLMIPVDENGGNFCA